MSEITKEIKEEIGILSKSDNEWTKELNLVSWNNNEAKYEIRSWSADKSKCSKGISMTKEELEKLKEILNDYLD